MTKMLGNEWHKKLAKILLMIIIYLWLNFDNTDSSA